MPRKAFHAQLVKEEDEREGELAVLPVLREMNEAMIKENFMQVKKDVADMVEKEIARMQADEELRKLIIR